MVQMMVTLCKRNWRNPCKTTWTSWWNGVPVISRMKELKVRRKWHLYWIQCLSGKVRVYGWKRTLPETNTCNSSLSLNQILKRLKQSLFYGGAKLWLKLLGKDKWMTKMNTNTNFCLYHWKIRYYYENWIWLLTHWSEKVIINRSWLHFKSLILSYGWVGIKIKIHIFICTVS